MGNREKSKWLGLELNQGQFIQKAWVVGLSRELLGQSGSMFPWLYLIGYCVESGFLSLELIPSFW